MIMRERAAAVGAQLSVKSAAGRGTQIIVTSIDPDSWEQRGGPGTIRYYAPTRSLVIRQSAEVHTMVKGSLYK